MVIVTQIVQNLISPDPSVTNRLLKCQNTRASKTGVFIKDSVMLCLIVCEIFLPGKVLSSGTCRQVNNINELYCSPKHQGNNENISLSIWHKSFMQAKNTPFEIGVLIKVSVLRRLHQSIFLEEKVLSGCTR